MTLLKEHFTAIWKTVNIIKYRITRMRSRILWQCKKCGFEIENNIELITKYGEPICMCGEYMLINVELE